jgi:hypothetical protein
MTVIPADWRSNPHMSHVSSYLLFRCSCGRPTEYPVGIYYGLGAGVYHYRLARSHVSTTTFGVNGTSGVEYVLPNDLVIIGEAQVHFYGGPGKGPVSRLSRLTLGMMIGMRVRL